MGQRDSSENKHPIHKHPIHWTPSLFFATPKVSPKPSGVIIEHRRRSKPIAQLSVDLEKCNK